MCKSCNLGFVAFLGFVTSIVGALQLTIVVIYYAELPQFFLVLSLVTGIFVAIFSSCIVISIIKMSVTSVNKSGKIGVSFALGSICMVTTVYLLLLLLQCHWILDQKVLTDIGLFQLQCIKYVTDISQGIFLLILTNSVTLGISTIALILACFWKARKHPDVLQISVSSNWVYENNSDKTNKASEIDMKLTDHNFKQSRPFRNRHVQLPKIQLKSIRKGSVSSNQLLKNILKQWREHPELPRHTFTDVLAATSPQEPSAPSLNSLISLTSFRPGDVKERSEHYY